MPSDDLPDPPEMPNPFGGMPFFADMAKAMSAQGPLNWEMAKQFAALAVGDSPDENPDPQVRFAFAELATIADMHVQDVTTLSTDPRNTRTELHPTTRALWAHRTLQDFRPLFTDLANALSQRPTTDSNQDPMSAMLSGLSAMMSPALLGMSIGSMIGAMAQRAFGQYDLPLPRPSTSQLMLVPSSIEAFATDWSLNIDDVRMWVLIHELTSHAVLSTNTVDQGVTVLVRQHVGAFRPDANAIFDKLSDLDISDPSAMQNLQNVFADPTALMGAVRTPEQERIAPLLHAHASAVVSYIDHVVDLVTERILGGGKQIAEAARRRRLETGPDAVFVEHLLGLKLSHQQLQSGRAFIEGVVQRGGEETLLMLVADATNLPTPNELEAPGLWIARLELQ